MRLCFSKYSVSLLFMYLEYEQQSVQKRRPGTLECLRNSFYSVDPIVHDGRGRYCTCTATMEFFDVSVITKVQDGPCWPGKIRQCAM